MVCRQHAFATDATPRCGLRGAIGSHSLGVDADLDRDSARTGHRGLREPDLPKLGARRDEELAVHDIPEAILAVLREKARDDPKPAALLQRNEQLDQQAKELKDEVGQTGASGRKKQDRSRE